MSEIYHTPQEAVTPRHRHVSCEVYHLAGIDFARQQNARGLIVYTSLLGDGCGGPQPRAWNMTIMREPSGWLVSCYGTYGALLFSLVLKSGKRDDVERVARRTLEAFVSRKLHAAKCEHLWRVRKAIRRQAEAQVAVPSADGSPIFAGAAVRPGGPGCPGCPGEEAQS